MAAYYNEWDSYAAAWLRNLIAAGHLPAGDVDERSITEVGADDLKGYTACHFFAGIGGWARALRLAGWDDARPVWTGSCPCQPFSAAGKRKGVEDERHLWPEFRRLIAECQPDVVFGEQVASADGRKWLAGREGLQRLRDREALVGILSERNILDGLPDALQGMLQVGRGIAQSPHPEGSSQRRPPEVEAAEPRIRAGSPRGAQGEDEGAAVYDQRGGNTVDDRQGRVPDDRHSVQPRRGQDMGQPLAGPDRQFAGLHTGEHAGRSLCAERDGEHLGRTQNHRDSRSDHGPAPERVGGFAVEAGIRIEAAAEFEQLAGVRTDLEGLAYAVGAADLCAAGIGAPHIRQRLWWVADSDGGIAGNGHLQPGGQHGLVPAHGGTGERVADADQQQLDGRGDAGPRGRGEFADGREAIQLEHATGDGREQRGAEPGGRGAASGRGDSGMGHADDARPQGRGGDLSAERPGERAAGPAGASFWGSAEWLACADGKSRRTQPGIFPLAHGVSARVGKLRAAGNAIVPQVAAEFIGAWLDARP